MFRRQALTLGSLLLGAITLGGWTLFYWGWWISWSPFVGMFIAKISRGRTVREFITAVLFVLGQFLISMYLTRTAPGSAAS